MKKVIIFFLLLSSVVLKAQNDSTAVKASSGFLIGGGIGVNYGGHGIKGVLGYKGNGLLVGFGLAKGKLLKQVGIQATYKWVFATITTGDYTTYEVYNTDIIELAKGQTFTAGCNISLSGTKRIFLELGIGYSWGDRITNEDGDREDLKKMSYSVGITFNI